MRTPTRERMISITALALVTLIEEPLVRVPGGLSATRKLSTNGLLGGLASSQAQTP